MSDPAWTIVADFAAGTYERDSVAVSLGDILTSDVNWGGYSPSHVQSGVGLVNAAGSASKPVLVDPGAFLANGFVGRFVFDFVEALPSPAAFQVNALDIANWSQEFDVTARSPGSVGAKTGVSSPGGVVEIAAPSPGEHTIDVRYEVGRTCVSIDGGAQVALLDQASRAWDTIGFSVTRGALKSMRLAPL